MLDAADSEIKILEEKSDYKTKGYTVSELNGDVIQMETGLPTKDIFNIIVKYAYRFQNSINYFIGWKVESTSFEDQIYFDESKTELHRDTGISANRAGPVVM